MISHRPWRGLLAAGVRKAITLAVAGTLLGWAYDWASTRLYPAEATAGFWRGVAHGGLMPAALPSLLMGKDVPIFAPNNDGRRYKIGYIAGINVCGLVFFGLAFRKSAQKQPGQSSLPEIEPAQKSQL